MTVIALWLGHESPSTTHMYIEADLAMKERALPDYLPGIDVRLPIERQIITEFGEDDLGDQDLH
jgi:hypothetical protein